MSAASTAAVVYLGRPGASGELQRVDSWMRLLEAAGFAAFRTPLLPLHRRRIPVPGRRELSDLLRGRKVPESAVWNPRSAAAELDALDPRMIIVETARAYDVSFMAPGRVVVLDFVDALSRSYRDRGHIVAAAPAKLVYHVLSRAHRRFERTDVSASRRVAAGVGDARLLDAEWLPNLVVGCPPRSAMRAEVDVLFFGNLSYPPNVQAVRRLGGLWPRLLQARPLTSARVAGLNPTSEVRELAAGHGWELVANYADLDPIARTARLAVFPIDHLSGISNKSLDAACLGLAQVATPACLAGFEPDFPAARATSDDEFIAEVVRLLDDQRAREALATAAQRYVDKKFRVQAWTDWAAGLDGI